MPSTTTVRAYPAPEPTPNISIDFSPHGNPFSYTVGEETYSPANTFYARLGVAITLTATVTFYVTGQLAVGYEWRLGDGTTGSTNPVVHTYTLLSEVPVTLIVTDNRGVKHRAYKTLYLRSEGSSLAITGTAQVGKILTATGGNLATPTYQWQKATTSGGTYSNIAGATSSSWTVTETYLNQYIRCQATNVTTETSNVLGPVIEAPANSAPTNKTAPSITSSAHGRESITTTNGTWTNSPTGYTYKWQVNFGTWENISGATGSTYELPENEYEGHYVRCYVTATNSFGSGVAISNECFVEQFFES